MSIAGNFPQLGIFEIKYGSREKQPRIQVEVLDEDGNVVDKEKMGNLVMLPLLQDVVQAYGMIVKDSSKLI